MKISENENFEKDLKKNIFKNPQRLFIFVSSENFSLFSKIFILEFFHPYAGILFSHPKLFHVRLSLHLKSSNLSFDTFLN